MKNFQEDNSVGKNKSIKIIQLSNSRCPPCKVIKSHILSKKYKDVDYTYFSFDKEDDNINVNSDDVTAVLKNSNNKTGLPLIGIIVNNKVMSVDTIRSTNDLDKLVKKYTNK